MSDDFTDMVLDGVRELRAQFLSSPPSAAAFPPVRPASSSFHRPRVLRVYSTRPETSPSTDENAGRAYESRKRPISDEGAEQPREMEKRKSNISINEREQRAVCSPVLRFSLSNVTYRVNLDALGRVFSQYGRVVKISTFPNQGTTAGHVQFDHIASAEMTMNKLQGRNIYHGCCRLHLTVTDIPDLTIRSDDDHSRDYTRPNHRGHDERRDRGFPSSSSPMGRVPDRRDAVFSPTARFPNYRDPAHSPMGIVPEVGYARDHWSDQPGAAPPIRTLWPDAERSFYDEGNTMVQGPQTKTVLYVSNLNESKATPQRLFMIFGIYCDVLKVKVFYHERSKAVVQAADAFQAAAAREFLNDVELWGLPINVAFASAKYQEIQITGRDETHAKDFSLSAYPIHRFRKPFGNKNLQNVTSPITTLYVSNLPADATEENLKSFFEKSILEGSEEDETADEVKIEITGDGGENPKESVKCIQFFRNNKSMAFVLLADVQSAFDAIVNVHGKRLPGASTGAKVARPMFVNFSKVHLDDYNKSGWSSYFRG